MALIPFTYLNIHEFDEKNENEKIRYFYVDNKTIKIKEFQEKGIGGKFWDCVSRIKLYIFTFTLVNNFA